MRSRHAGFALALLLGYLFRVFHPFYVSGGTARGDVKLIAMVGAFVSGP